MNESMNEGPSPAGGSSGQAPLSGGPASNSGTAPQRPQSMATLRPRGTLNRQMQGTLPGRKKAALSKPDLLKKKALARMLKNKKSMKKRAALRTLRP